MAPDAAPPGEDIEVTRIQKDLADLHPAELDHILTEEEKRLMLYVERGDVASVKHVIKKGKKENMRKKGAFNLNCMDPLGRSALAIAVENENIDLMEVLLAEGIEPTDSLLHAVAEQYVEGVEALLEHEEKIHKPGDRYSWEKAEGVKASFTSDITPLILAAHKDNYEILRILLDRGATLPTPHDVKCACDDCIVSSEEDSLRHSLARINAYKALSSPSLICLSSKDPIATAIALSQELGKLAVIEKEFCEQYIQMNEQVQEFSSDMIEQTRSCLELEVVLNYDKEGPVYEPGQHMHLTSLRDAVDKYQKSFVAHANVQQLLASVWYGGVEGFRRQGSIGQIVSVVKVGACFPLYCMMFIMLPGSSMGKALRQPLVKFIVHTATYFFFLTLLVVVSLDLEYLVIDLFGTEWMRNAIHKKRIEARGALPGFVELLVIIYVMGFIWGEIKCLWADGLEEYVSDLWNIVDYIINFFFFNWILLRTTAFYLTQREIAAGINPYMKKELWDPFDPMLVAEGMFGAANVFSFLKLVHTFSVNPHMGPLQISLGRMVFDIMKFFFLYSLVLFAFGCGMNNLLWYYSDIDKGICYSLPGGLQDPDQEHSCEVWRRWINLWETSQSLFWASFGLVDMTHFELTGLKSFTRFWALLMFGSYSVINVIVLLNLLIAMMSNSYAFIVERSDVEWKFARAKLWMQYFEDGGELPPPFNLIPNFGAIFGGGDKKSKRESFKRRQDALRDEQYQGIMRNLVRRFVTKQQQEVEEQEINEDDVNEIKQDINSFKFEILNILKINGMKTGTAHQKEDGAMGHKQQARERRLMKGFNIGIVEGLEGAEGGASKAEDKIKKMAMAMGFLGGKKKRKSGDWNEQSARRKSSLIGNSRTQIRRQSLRESCRKKTAWNKVKFYQRRGVFMGGAINAGVLEGAHVKIKPELRTELRGWRKVQRLTDQGKIRLDNVKEDAPQQYRKMSVHQSKIDMDSSTAKDNKSRDKSPQGGKRRNIDEDDAIKSSRSYSKEVVPSYEEINRRGSGQPRGGNDNRGYQPSQPRGGNDNRGYQPSQPRAGNDNRYGEPRGGNDNRGFVRDEGIENIKKGGLSSRISMFENQQADNGRDSDNSRSRNVGKIGPPPRALNPRSPSPDYARTPSPGGRSPSPGGRRSPSPGGMGEDPSKYEVVRRRSPVPPSGDHQPPPQKRMLVSPPITIQPPTPLPTPTPSPAGTLVAEHRTRPVVPKTVEASKPADENAEVIPKIPPPAKAAPKEDKKDEAPKAAKAPPPAGQKIKELDRNMWEPKLKGKWL